MNLLTKFTLKNKQIYWLNKDDIKKKNQTNLLIKQRWHKKKIKQMK